MVRRKVVEWDRRLGVSAQGLGVHEHVVCLPLTLDRHEPRDTAAGAGDGALACVVRAHPREVIVEVVRLRERELEVA